MMTFKNSLSTAQLNELGACLDDDRFYTWHNTPNVGGTSRDGITYGDLDASQLNNFKSLLQLFLSNEGYQKVDEITTLAEGFLSDQNASVWNTDYYSIDLFGDPENSGSWGFQLDGHHLAINFLVHGDDVSIVPAFLGGEPAAETYNGTDFDIFKDERDIALTLYNGLNATELAEAEATGNRAFQAGPPNQNGQVDAYRGDHNYSGFQNGLKYSNMSSTTQAEMINLMKEYVYNLNSSFADLWWADIMANIDDTYFLWMDEVTSPSATSQFYYRIYNPFLFVEFNNEDVVGGTIDSWNHIHTITRIPNNPTTSDKGGDYGIFASQINHGPATLYEHYALAEHHQKSSLIFDYQIDPKLIEVKKERSKHNHSPSNHHSQHHSHKHPPS